MPIIPKGDNLGNNLIKAGRTNLQGDNGAVGRAMAGLGRDVMGLGLAIDRENENTNRVAISNAALERKKQVDATKNDLEQKLKMGELQPDEAIDTYKKSISELPTIQVNGLNSKQQEELNYHFNVIDYNGEQQVQGLRKTAQVTRAQSVLADSFNLANEELLSPNADLAGVTSRFNNVVIDKTGMEAYGDKWGQVKKDYLTKLDINYLQNQINHAGETENSVRLAQLRNAMLDDTQFKNLNAVQRKTLLNQIEPVLDRSIGTNYGKQLSQGLVGLSTATGNFDAANVFNAMIQRESGGNQFDSKGNPLTSTAGAVGKAQVMPETAKAMAKELGVAFDENRYKTDPEYNVMLGQAYFQKNLNKYGSPLMAAAAYNAGDGAVDKWIARFGDPRKGEISEQEFLAKIPYKETREYVQYVAGKVSNSKKGKIDKSGALALIDNSNLSYEQKQYARAEFSKGIAIQEEQQRAQYQAVRDGVWTDIVEGGKTIDEIEPQRLAMLTIDDRKAMRNYKPVKEDDIRAYEQALYQVNNGIDIDLYGTYRDKLTNGTIKSLINKQASIKNNGDKANSLFSTISLFNSKAKASGVKQGTDNYIALQNATMQALEERQNKEGRKLTQKEQLEVIDNQFVQGYVKGGGVLFGDSNFRSFYFESDDKNKFYINRIGDVPNNAKEILTQRFKARGIEPTNELIIRAYNKVLQNGR